jgi:hypothetical protein
MASQEKIRAMTNSIQSKFEETINSWVEGIPASVDSQTRNLCGKYSSEVRRTLMKNLMLKSRGSNSTYKR